MNKTSIEYADYTWNPVHGCTPVDEGCCNCWADRMAGRLARMGMSGYDLAAPFMPKYHANRLREPSQVLRPAVIAVAFMGDLFHPDLNDSVRDDVFLAMRRAPWHRYLILTKRSAIMVRYLDEADWLGAASHIYMGVSVSGTNNDRLTDLAAVAAMGWKTWISAEPLLGELILGTFRPDWLVIGCESGPGRRPMDNCDLVQAVLSARRLAVPVIVKQMEQSGRIVSMPSVNCARPADGLPDDIAARLRKPWARANREIPFEEE